MKISVILCTYNRCESLAKALGSAAGLTLPESTDWQVLVVDNNSTDQTREVAEDFCRRHPGRFRYVFEPRPGKSYALESGLREASGDVLAFMDDDVTVEPMWLENLTSPLLDGKWAGTGGRILPNWTCAAPPWLDLKEKWALAPLALFDLGPDAGPLTEAPFGTNMAFQKRMFEKYGGFRTDLGPQPGSEIRNEDSEFGRRLLQAGERFWYEPSAIVYHSVPQKRIQKRYFLTWWFDKGRADARERGIPADTMGFIAGIPLYLFRRIAVWTFRWMVTPIPTARFACKLKVWVVAGAIKEFYLQSRSQSSATVSVPDRRSS
jgi:glycosyltransferase involved in cell wall biosynthesis